MSLLKIAPERDKSWSTLPLFPSTPKTLSCGCQHISRTTHKIFRSHQIADNFARPLQPSACQIVRNCKGIAVMSNIVRFKRRRSTRQSLRVRSSRPKGQLSAMAPLACLVLVAGLLAAKESALIPGLSPSQQHWPPATFPKHPRGDASADQQAGRKTTGPTKWTSVERSFPSATFGSIEVAGQSRPRAIATEATDPVQPTPSDLQPTATAPGRRPIYVCSGGGRQARGVTCIVDGDTGWENGMKWRLVDKDTPELSHPACNREYRLAVRARDRLIQLMSEGYVVEPSGGTGRYGRQLVRIRLSSGEYAGDVLMREGLAQPWPNTGNVWCFR